MNLYGVLAKCRHFKRTPAIAPAGAPIVPLLVGFDDAVCELVGAEEVVVKVLVLEVDVAAVVAIFWRTTYVVPIDGCGGVEAVSVVGCI
jgi:hypothetical protein